jgi:hypothetical protein
VVGGLLVSCICHIQSMTAVYNVAVRVTVVHEQYALLSSKTVVTNSLTTHCLSSESHELKFSELENLAFIMECSF